MVKDVLFIIYIYIYEFTLSSFRAFNKVEYKLDMNRKRKKIILDRIKSSNITVYKLIKTIISIIIMSYILIVILLAIST
jgi:hypothetical protein